MLKYLSTCPVTVYAAIYSNLFHRVVCFVPIFADKFPLTIKEFIQIHLILTFASALPLVTKILHRYVPFAFKALHVCF